MLKIRYFEEKVYELYLNGKLISMSPHLSIGQEAVAVGVCGALRRDDYIVSSHRGHGHCLAKGGEMRPMMAEICTKETGYCKGRGGTMHIANLKLGILGANGIVGAGLPIAAGAGISIKYRGTDQVVVCFFGDGASNQGTFHESVNLSSAFKLPVIWVCENNVYALSTPIYKTGATPDVADRAKGYNIPGVVVDGMDVIAVYEVASAAVDRARDGEGPSLIECKTYRFLGHGASDNRSYRTREEEEEWKRKDPILRFKRKLLDENILSEEEIKAMEERAKAEAQDAADFALSSPEPNPRTVMENIYA
ncbi:MAG: thiamine pyrophosphate-dependent dehydrogenase E1 component subunit alpha [bacterium]